MKKKFFKNAFANFREKLFSKNNLADNQLNITGIENLVGYKINNPSLFKTAFTHRSVLENGQQSTVSNERLEFLGDSILGFIVGKYLYLRFPDKDEGFLTKFRSNIVMKESLYGIAKENNLQNLILYNKKFINPQSEGFKSICADTMEAIIAAVYFDGGLEKAEDFVIKKIILPYFSEHETFIDTNYKGILLEYSHTKKISPPKYEIIKEEGPPHNKHFFVKVTVGNTIEGFGEGKSKKSAEQEAAFNAISKLDL